MRSILVNWRKYTPFGELYYQPLFDCFISNLGKYTDEFDKLYLLDSNWNFGSTIPKLNQKLKDKWKIIKVPENLRYYEAYQKVLPKIETDLLMFMDNDLIVYKRGIIKKTFDFLEEEQDEENKINKTEMDNS